MSTISLAPILGPVYGSVFFSVVLTTLFYGVTCMQTFFYYVHYQDDLPRIKIFVAVIWTLNTIHEALAIAGAYKYFIAGLMDPMSFLTAIPEFILQGLPTALVAVCTQGFLVHRIYVFSGKKIVAPLIWVMLAILQLVPITIYFAKALYSANGVHAVDVTVLSGKFLTTQLTLQLSVAAGEDVLIAIFMTYLLFRERAATGFKSTAHILQRLTVFAVNTGIWPATFALLTIVLLQSFPSNLLYVVFASPLCSVYCNTVLANLNVRVYMTRAPMPSVSMDLIKSSSSPVFENPNKHCGDAFAAREEAVMLSDPNQSTTSADV